MKMKPLSFKRGDYIVFNHRTDVTIGEIDEVNVDAGYVVAKLLDDKLAIQGTHYKITAFDPLWVQAGYWFDEPDAPFNMPWQVVHIYCEIGDFWKVTLLDENEDRQTVFLHELADDTKFTLR